MKVNNTFWAKKKEQNGMYYWLPLSQHLEDTKNIIGLLWEHWLSPGQKEFIESSLSYKQEELGKNLAKFIGAIHDIGKATPAFQLLQNRFINSEELDDLLVGKLEASQFKGISSTVLQSPKKTNHSIAGQYMLYKFGVKDDITTIVSGHHGKPINSSREYKDQRAYKTNYYQTEETDSFIYKKWAKEQKNIFDWALLECDFKNVEDLPEIKQPAQVILSGLLIMADWIVSNENYFPLIPIDEYKVLDNKKRYQEGFIKWKKDNVIWSSKYDLSVEQLYKSRFGFKPNEIQTKLFEIIENSDNSQIFIIEAPMGIGKTEAALISVEQLANKTGSGGMFLGLPTQATSNGIFPRIISWLNNIEIDDDEKISLRLSHGKAYLNETFNSLSSGINLDESGNSYKENISINEWFSGRKTSSLDDFVVGTVDQFLMLSLKQKHLVLRHLGFSKKVVVIDEVHAYDAYMNQYLKKSIVWMGAYGVPVIILSATLPQERRLELIKSYMRGKGIKYSREEKNNIKNKLSTNAYPLISYNDDCEIKIFSDFKKAKNHNKVIKIIKETDEKLLDLVDTLILEEGILGIVVNTVKKAQILAKDLSQIYGEDMVELLHSRFISTHRVKKEAELMSIIGKNANRPKKKIIIGTQVIEQSLDIDFDVMISELAPIDLLIQRMGRLHRHNIERPRSHKEAKFYVLGCNLDLDFDKGSSVVYSSYLLTRTQYYLPNEIVIPQDISVLVQKVYDFDLKNNGNFEDINLSESLIEKYNKFKNEYRIKIEKKELKAKSYRISAPVLNKTIFNNNTLIGWLNNDLINQSEEKANAQVRDINESIEVIALKKQESGYSIFGEELDISKAIEKTNIAKEIAKNTILLPSIFSQPYKIDETIEELEKYNLKHLKKWQESIWLKGTLGIIFDDNNEFELCGRKIKYNIKYGISLVEEEVDGKI